MGLNSEGYEYRADLAEAYRTKPTRRRHLDSVERAAYGSLGDKPVTRVWRRGVRNGDSRICKNCPHCLRFNRDFYSFGQRSKNTLKGRFKPGEGLSFDGAFAGTDSKFGNFSIILIAIDMA